MLSLTYNAFLKLKSTVKIREKLIKMDTLTHIWQLPKILRKMSRRFDLRAFVRGVNNQVAHITNTLTENVTASDVFMDFFRK